MRLPPREAAAVAGKAPPSVLGEVGLAAVASATSNDARPRPYLKPDKYPITFKHFCEALQDASNNVCASRKEDSGRLRRVGCHRTHSRDNMLSRPSTRKMRGAEGRGAHRQPRCGRRRSWPPPGRSRCSSPASPRPSFESSRSLLGPLLGPLVGPLVGFVVGSFSGGAAGPHSSASLPGPPGPPGAPGSHESLRKTPAVCGGNLPEGPCSESSTCRFWSPQESGASPDSGTRVCHSAGHPGYPAHDKSRNMMRSPAGLASPETRRLPCARPRSSPSHPRGLFGPSGILRRTSHPLPGRCRDHAGSQ